MKNLIGRFLLLTLILNTASLSAQIVQSESFDGTTFLPAGWTSIYSGPTLYFTRQTTGTFPSCAPNSGAAMGRFNSRTAPAGTTQAIVTPVFDLTSVGTDTARVSLWIFRNDTLPAAYDTVNVMVNTSADTTGAVVLGTIARSIAIALPDTQATSGWYQYTFDIPATFNGNSNYLIFRFTARSGNGSGYRIFFDDFSWDTYPAICSGAPAQANIVPANRVICGGPAPTTLSLDSTVNELGLSYQWQSSADGITFTDIGTSATTITTDTLFATTYFRCAVICTTTNDTTFTAVDSVVVSPDPVPVVTVASAAVNYCLNSGNPAMLIGSGGQTYSWSPSNGLSGTTTDTVFATPAFSTTYTVTGFDSYGCFDTAQVRVTIRQTPTVNATPATASTCVGDSITLSASSTGLGGGGGTTVTYTWTPGNLTGSIIRVPVDSTITYFVTGVTNFGCSGPQSTDSVVIEGLPTPVAGTISTADSVICGGPNTTTLSMTGGTAGSAISYTWYSGSSDTGPWNPLTGTNSSVTSDTLSSLTYFICVISCSSGSSDTSAAVAVNVSPDPLPVISIPVFQNYYCTGSNPTEIVISSSTAVTYSWSPNTGVTTSSDTAFFTPTSSTTYIVTGVDTYGCSDTATVRVSVRSIPVVTATAGASTICEGDSVTLDASFVVGGGGAGSTTMTYTWEPGGLTGQSITVSPTDTTDYIVTGVSNFGCTGETSIDTVSIAVNLLTQANFTSSAIAGLTFTFTNNSANANSYLWDFGTGDTSTSDNPDYTFQSPGLYPVTLIATGLCNSDTVTDTLNVIIDLISTADQFTMYVAPNPAHEMIKVQTSSQAGTITITDIIGNIVEVRNSIASVEVFDVRNLKAGVYFIRLSNGSRIQTTRFVKE